MSLEWAIKVLSKMADSLAPLPVGDESGSLVNWSLQEVRRKNWRWKKSNKWYCYTSKLLC